MILVLVVVAMAATGDRVSGALAALSSAIGFDFFVASPRLDFDIDDVADVEMAILLLLVGIAVSELALRGRRQQAAASERSGYLSGVLESAELAARGIPISDAIPTVAGHIWRTLGAERVTYEQGVPHRDCAIIQRDGTVTLEGDPLDVTRDGLPADRNTAVLVGPAGAGRRALPGGAGEAGAATSRAVAGGGAARRPDRAAQGRCGPGSGQVARLIGRRARAKYREGESNPYALAGRRV